MLACQTHFIWGKHWWLLDEKKKQTSPKSLTLMDQDAKPRRIDVWFLLIPPTLSTRSRKWDLKISFYFIWAINHQGYSSGSQYDSYMEKKIYHAVGRETQYLLDNSKYGWLNETYFIWMNLFFVVEIMFFFVNNWVKYY